MDNYKQLIKSLDTVLENINDKFDAQGKSWCILYETQINNKCSNILRSSWFENFLEQEYGYYIYMGDCRVLNIIYGWNFWVITKKYYEIGDLEREIKDSIDE